MADGVDVSMLADGDLARRVADASEAAESELYARFARRVRLYGLKHLGDSDEADDLVQEVMQTVLKKLKCGEVREPDKVASFVLGTARQLVKGQNRTRVRRAAILTQYADPNAAAEPPTGHGAMLERLAQCLTSLTERARSVLVLSFYAELSAADIAIEMGTSAGNVRVIRHRGIEQLGRCVRGEEGGVS